jgi:hypothetical protein
MQHWWCVYFRWTWLLLEYRVFNGLFMFKSCMFLYVCSFKYFFCLHFFCMLFKPHFIDMKFIFICSSSLVCVLHMEMLRKSFCGDIFRYSQITWYLKKILTVSFYFLHIWCVVLIYENTAELFLAMFVIVVCIKSFTSNKLTPWALSVYVLLSSLEQNWCSWPWNGT